MESVFRILGPLEVELDERVVSLGGRRERAILAILLLNIGEVVSVERLIDGLWGEARPSSAKHMVHEYVSRLRTALVEVAPIATRPPGYLLESAGEALDVRQFTQITGVARAAAGAQHQAEALRSYDQALALWRGDALADIALEGHAQIATARLDQERRLVGEERIDCALALGRHLQLIPELEHRVDEAPLREHSRAQLMLALYRAGRQTEALERFREGRALLVEHAGVEPGRELRDLERAILTQDRALELEHPVQDHAVAEGAARVHSPEASVVVSARRRWRRLVVPGVLLAAAVGTLIFTVGRTNSAHALARIDANSVGAIDPGHNRLVDEVPVGTGPGRIAAGFGSLWVVNDFDSTISRIDPAGGGVQVIPVDGDPTAIAVGAGFVWVACSGTRSVDRIDPELNRRTQRIPVGNGPSGIAIGSGAVWVTNRLDDTVTKIDSKTGTILRHLNAGPSPSDIAYGLGALWVANESASTVTRLDPRTGGLQEFNVGNGPEAVAIGNGSVWVANNLDGTVSRIDPNSNIVTSRTVGPGPSSVLASDGAIWVADSYGGRIVRIDPASMDVVRTIAVGSGPQSLAALGGRIWLSARETATVHRGGTLRLFELNAPDSLDAAGGYGGDWRVSSVSGDGLVGFKRVGGVDGGTLVPDLAASRPVPTNEGRTYTFQLRRGIRYSNGEPLRASDIRRALERTFRFGSSVNNYYRGLLGADECSKARCDLSRGVVTDDQTGSVILHLRKPDPELLYKLTLPSAFPVPPEISMTKPAPLGVPGTGPYMIRSYKKGARLVLVRNPHFRQWSAAAQPNGYPDRIVVTYGSALGKQLTAIERGNADLMESPFPANRVNEIETRYAAQVHVFPASRTFAVFLNTRLPPFDKLAARRAFSYAIDRSKAIPGFGGVKEAAVTCQIIPAGMAGYRPYCPFTRNPTRNGVWTGPDLRLAQKLVTASGTRGEKVVLWTGAEPLERVTGNLALATLKELGYRASQKILPDAKYWSKANDSRTGIQAGFYAWAQDYPAASNFLTLFTCNAFLPANLNNVNLAEICNPRIDHAVANALARQTTDPRATTDATWAAVDRLVTDLVPWAPIVNPREAVVVSRRVGNVQANPQWGLLIDQMWVR
jgi:peptide/nickel transport system substrate-binding protein